MKDISSFIISRRQFTAFLKKKLQTVDLVGTGSFMDRQKATVVSWTNKQQRIISADQALWNGILVSLTLSHNNGTEIS